MFAFPHMHQSLGLNFPFFCLVSRANELDIEVNEADDLWYVELHLLRKRACLCSFSCHSRNYDSSTLILNSMGMTPASHQFGTNTNRNVVHAACPTAAQTHHEPMHVNASTLFRASFMAERCAIRPLVTNFSKGYSETCEFLCLRAKM